MRGRMVLRTIRLGGWDPSVLRELALAALFLAGALAGHLYAGSRGEETWTALGRYLDDYCRLCDAGGAETSLVSCLVMYFGYGAALFLLGFSAAGVALIPALSGAFGFFTMYTVSCFVRCYGRHWRRRRGSCPWSCSPCPLAGESGPCLFYTGVIIFCCFFCVLCFWPSACAVSGF